MTLRWGILLLLMMGAGCATSQVVRLDTGEGQPLVYKPRTDDAPARLEADEFQEAVQKLAPTAPLSSRPRESALRLFNQDHHHARLTVRGRMGVVSVDDP